MEESGLTAIDRSRRSSDKFEGPRFVTIARWLGPEFLGYGLVSAIALLTDIGVLRALVTLARRPCLTASAFAFVAGAAVSYLLCVQFVFKARRLENRTLEFGFFLGLGLVGLLVY